jgi:hypothetical protein
MEGRISGFETTFGRENALLREISCYNRREFANWGGRGGRNPMKAPA